MTFLIFGTSLAQEEPQEYIISSTGEKILGKVTFAPGDKVSFKAEGTKQSKDYLPTQLKAYFDKGYLHKAKYIVEKEEYIFFPSFQKGDDVKKFEKAFHLKMKATGPISIYSITKNYISSPIGNGRIGTGFGPTYTSFKSVSSFIMDIEKNGTIIPFSTSEKQAPAELLDAIKDNLILADRIRHEKAKFDLDYITSIILEYNAWYEATYATH